MSVINVAEVGDKFWKFWAGILSATAHRLPVLPARFNGSRLPQPGPLEFLLARYLIRQGSAKAEAIDGQPIQCNRVLSIRND
jgi:hypothetical protein